MNLPEEVTGLMQQEIDGANTPAESARLRDLLRGDPAARALFEELKMVARAVEDAALPPPPGLRQAVLDAIAVAPSTRRSAFAAWLHALRANHVMVLRYAVVLLAGVALGLVGGHGIWPLRHAPPPGSVVGTLAPAGQGSGRERQVDFRGLRGVVRWNQAPSVVVLECDLKGQGASDMIVTFDPGQARFDGLEAAGPEDLSLRLEEGRVSLHGSFGSPFTLRLARTGSGDIGAAVQLLRDGMLTGPKDLTFAVQ